MFDDLFDDDLLDVDDIGMGEVMDGDALSSESDGSIDDPAGSGEVSFLGAKYTDAEISRMRDDVARAEYEVNCRDHDVKEWESKVSLNNTKEKIASGDYAAAVSRLNEAKSRYNAARSALSSAQSKLNHAL